MFVNTILHFELFHNKEPKKNIVTEYNAIHEIDVNELPIEPSKIKEILPTEEIILLED